LRDCCENKRMFLVVLFCVGLPSSSLILLLFLPFVILLSFFVEWNPKPKHFPSFHTNSPEHLIAQKIIWNLLECSRMFGNIFA
jgi:hypothetical protein